MSDTRPTIQSFVERLRPLWRREIELTEQIAADERGIVETLGLPTCKTYVMRAGARGLVKIGKAADVDARRRSLQTACPAKLRVLRVIHFDCERQMHERFAHVWKMGEWFEFDPDMLIVTFNEELLALAEAAITRAEAT